jgi:ABC-type lipoprotein release transport system permease subunit
MNAVWYRARAELRARWKAWLALAVLVGAVGGAVMAAAGGARRTDTAYRRFLVAQRAMDIVLIPEGSRDVPALSEVERLPGIIQSSRVYTVPGKIRTPSGRESVYPAVFPLIDPTGRFGESINRVKILEGRPPDPRRADEVSVTLSVARGLQIAVGDRLRFDVFDHDRDGNATNDVLTTLQLHVVAIEVAPGEFESLGGQSITGVHLSPALAVKDPRLLSRYEEALVLRVKNGGAGLDALQKEIERRGLPVEQAVSLPEQNVGVERSNRFQAIALWLIAALGGVTALAVFGQILARQAFLESVEYPTLRGLGMDQGHLMAVGMLRAAGIGMVAAAVSVVVAILLSPLTPTGLARVAEPTPGFRVDAVVLGFGTLTVIVLILGVSLLPVYRTARARTTMLGTAEIGSEERMSRLDRGLGGLGLPSSMAIGIRMGIDPGSGRTAVPVRSAILGTTFGIATVVAALTFSASLNHLTRSPDLFGWNWDAVTGPTQSQPTREDVARAESAIAGSPLVKEFGRGYPETLIVGGRPLLALGLDPTPVGPSMIDGHAPTAQDEIALGTDTLHQLHLGIGDIVEVRGQGDPSRGTKGTALRMRVVGRLAMPTFFLSFNRPGHGAAVTLGAMNKLQGETGYSFAFFVRFADGVSVRRGTAELERLGLFVLRGSESADLGSLRRVTNVPLVLAGLLSLMAAATVAHALVTSIRRRRRDFAILKTLGFVGRQVGATVAWQASTLVAVALVVGVPLGVAGGRWGWRAFSDGLGVVPAPTISGVTLLLLFPIAVLLTNLVAFVPGRIAARMHPAPVLRTE